MKKGFTIIELLISITVLATIMIVVMSLYKVAFREYPINFQKTKMQADVNFAADAIAQNTKNALSIPPTYGSFNRSETVLILEIPATDLNGDFIYNGPQPEKDIFIYELVDGSLKKRIFGSTYGRYSGQNGNPQTILNHVTGFSCTYSNQVSGLANYYKTLVFNLSTQVQTAGTTISFDVTKTANARNAP